MPQSNHPTTCTPDEEVLAALLAFAQAPQRPHGADASERPRAKREPKAA